MSALGPKAEVSDWPLQFADALDDPRVRQLMDIALNRAKSSMPIGGCHQPIIKSVSDKHDRDGL
jgi:hypothetical protein